MNESRDLDGETKIKLVERKRNYQKPEKEKPNKFRKVDCFRYRAPNCHQKHNCPVKTKTMRKLRQKRPKSRCENQPN